MIARSGARRFPRMQDNDDVAPARSTIARQQNAAISNGVNWIA